MNKLKLMRVCGVQTPSTEAMPIDEAPYTATPKTLIRAGVRDLVEPRITGYDDTDFVGNQKRLDNLSAFIRHNSERKELPAETD